jgi:cyanophycinase-like exopeptidase
MGRLLAFAARISTDEPRPLPSAVRAMGIDEETALLLDNDTGVVRTVGKNSAFICGASEAPAVCKEDTPLTFEGG